MLPSITFNTIAEWEAYIDQFIITNGVQEITGLIGNNSYNGAVTFIKKSPLNWSKAAIYSSGGVVSLANGFLGVAIFLTTTPTSLTWGDNFYNEYVLINMTTSDIPLAGSLVYYDVSGNPQDNVPANSAINIFKATNNLWVAASISGSSTGRAQKQPRTYIVGTTSGAPTAGQTTWTLPAFENSWVVLVIGRSVIVDMADAGDGGPYITKALGSDTLTISNWGTGWNTGDILSYLLFTP